jgi:hypothetical protein
MVMIMEPTMDIITSTADDGRAKGAEMRQNFS